MRKLLILLTAFLAIMTNCEKDYGRGLEVYFLTDFKTKTDSKEIISGSERLSKDPIIYYDDILCYDTINYCFKVIDAKAEELAQISWPTQGKAFSLTIDKSVIYSGYFMPGYSSSGADWFVINPFSFESWIQVNLGYPGEIERLIEIDPRNDARIIALLKRDNKLK